MARQVNPYFAPSGKYTGVAEGISNLGQIFLQSQDPSAGAAVERAAWSARKDREGVMDAMDARKARGALADYFRGVDPTSSDPRQAIASAVRGNALEPSKLGDLFRVAAGNVPGYTDEQRAGAAFGSGDFIGENDAVSLQDRERVAGRNAGNDQALQGVKNQGSLEQQRLKNQGEMDQLRFEVDNPTLTPGTGQAIQYELADGTIRPGTYNTRTGYLDASGQPMTMDSVANVFRIGSPQGTNEEIGLGKKATNDLEAGMVSTDEGLRYIDTVRQLADDPTNFGVTGKLKGTVQDAIQQGDALAQYLGDDARAIQADIASEGYDISLENFDPNLPKLDMMRNLLAYKMASALAGQEGRGLSDNDFRRFQEMFGSERLLANQKDFLNRLQVAEELLRGKADATDRFLTEGRGAAQGSGTLGDSFRQQSAPAPAAPAEPNIDTMSLQELQEMDASQMTDEQLQRAARRYDELQGSQ